jgi:hypothetical protein
MLNNSCFLIFLVISVKAQELGKTVAVISVWGSNISKIQKKYKLLIL